MPTTFEMLYGMKREDWKPNSKMLYTNATARGWKRDDVHRLIEKQFKKSSTKELSYEEYEKVIEIIDTFSPEVQE